MVKDKLIKKLAVIMMGAAMVISSILPASSIAFADSAEHIDVVGSRGGFSSCSLKLNDGKYLDKITKITVNEKTWEKIPVTGSLWGTGKYRLSESDSEIQFSKFNEGDKVKIFTDEGTLSLTVNNPDTLMGDIYDKESKVYTPNGGGGDPGAEPGTDPAAGEHIDITGSSPNTFSCCRLNVNDAKYLKDITGISVNGRDFAKTDNFGELSHGGKYSLDEGNAQIMLSPLSAGDKVAIKTAKGTLSLTIKDPTAFMGNIYDESSKVFTPAGSGGDTPVTPPGGETSFTITDKNGVVYFTMTFTPDDTAGKITGISNGDVPMKEKDSKFMTYTDGYYIDTDSKILYMNEPKDGDVLTFQMKDGSKHQFKYVKSNEKGKRFVEINNEPVTPQKFIKVKLVGKFEGAVVNQQKYDGVSGATTSVSTNKNSDVQVLAAETDKEDAVPADDAWVPLNKTEGLDIDHEKTEIVLDAESGMKGVYSTYDSSITLNGTPKKKGEYKVKVKLVLKDGRTAVSNELPFRVYGLDEKLIDYLKIENATQTADGKYMWDMEPWYIAEFGGLNETVTVPKDIKAWYGSHTSGMYGELGKPSSEGVEQTLILEDGTDLTLVNMKVKSRVKVIVKKGAKLCLRDSSMFGKIVVENGGTFQMNYDPHENKYLTGAQINGQLELKDGAVLDNSLIYSNTNFLTDNGTANKNVEPVVKVTGNVKVNGNVFVRGDEAPTGDDPATGKPYTGQPALVVENGNLDIAEGAVLGVYGGGRVSTTTSGAPAVFLKNGNITGNGKLIAIGGRGEHGDGGDAVAGEGSVSVKNAYLQGGNTYSADKKPGEPYAKGVKISKETIGVAEPGKNLKILGDNDQPNYWMNIVEPPAWENIDFGNEHIVYDDVIAAGEGVQKPAGYVTVTMDPGKNGKLAKGDAAKYYVNPNKEAEIPAKDAVGNKGYKFKAWDKSLKGTFKEDTTITATYDKLPEPKAADKKAGVATGDMSGELMLMSGMLLLAAGFGLAVMLRKRAGKN